MSRIQLKQFIESQGWSFYGISSYAAVRERLGQHEHIFQRWLEKGFHAEMDYLPKMKQDRYRPQNKLPDIESILVLAAQYSGKEKGKNMNKNIDHDQKNSSGIVARYAYGKDYHKVLKKKLIELSDYLKSQNPMAENYVSVDSGPTVDRVLAEAAGLGFFGKNSCLINPSKGSYFFIATLYTNLNLEMTERKRMPNCGDCQKCMVACPTGALKGPGQLDANLCISYLTIENKEGIPVELRSKIGDRLFGCDICQEICPFNIGRAHRQEVTIESIKSVHGVGGELDLKEILSIRTDEEFVKKFAGTPLMRAKRRGLIRNACVVAGNSRDKSLIPFLNKIIVHEADTMLQEHAKWAVEQLERLSLDISSVKRLTRS